MFDIIGGVGVLRDCMGRMGLEGDGAIQLHVRDSAGYDVSINIGHKAAILEKSAPCH